MTQHSPHGAPYRVGAAVRVLLATLVAAVVALGVLAPTPASAASTVDFVVNSTGDAGDARIDGTCATSTRVCTLRAAMQEANQRTGHVVIGFNLPAGSTIAVGSRLPAMLNPAGTTLDGYTQPGASPNTAPHGSNAVLGVRVRGKGAAAFHGLVVQSPGNEIRGLAIYDFRIAIQITGEAVSGTVVAGNFICTDPTGTFRAPSLNGGAAGVVINDSAHENTIGGPLPSDRNVISGCAHRGVIISYTGADHNVVQNNVVGLTPSGDGALPNLSHGLDVNYTAQDNLFIGNVVSGNAANGIEISHGNANRRNDVIGNFVGTTIDGTGVAPYTPNLTYGVRLEGNYPCEAPCPPNAGYSTVSDNVIVGNATGGLFIDKGNSFNTVRDNLIGVLPDGTPAGNLEFGVRIEYGSSGNVIGPGNVIAHNQRGVQMVATGSQPPSGGVTAVVRGNTLTRNSIHDNERLGVDLAPLTSVNVGGVGDAKVQDAVQAPVVTRATTTVAEGTACAGCTVEVFGSDATSVTSTSSPDNFGEGRDYVGSAVAGSDGRWTANLGAGLTAGGLVTANATTPPARPMPGSTSEFSRNVVVTTPAGAPVLQSVTPADGSTVQALASAVLRFDRALAPSSTAQLTRTGAGAVAADVSVGGDGRSLVVEPTATLPDGDYRLQATAVAASGGVTTQVVSTFTVQSVGAAPTIDPLAVVDAAAAGRLDVAGAAAPGSVVTVVASVGSAQVEGSATAGSGGRWSLALDLTPLADGAVTVTAVAVQGGTTSPPASASTEKWSVLPGAPTIVQVPTTSGTATPSWTAPDLGGAPLVAYTVSVTGTLSGTRQLTTTATQLSLTGLTSGDQLLLSVQAVTRAGAGPVSAPVSAFVAATAARTRVSRGLDTASVPAGGTVTMTGTVIHADSGRPVAGVRVEVFREGGTTPVGGPVLTAVDGTYVVPFAVASSGKFYARTYPANGFGGATSPLTATVVAT